MIPVSRGRLTFESSKERKTIKFQGFGSVNEIREIERGDIISDHDVRIYHLDEISPSKQQFGFRLVTQHVRTDYMCTCVESENIPNKRLLITW